MKRQHILTKTREHVKAMGYAQRDAWGLDYIDLYLIHFPVALKYIEPEKLRYPVRVALLFI
jgi:D-xylose reductase